VFDPPLSSQFAPIRSVDIRRPPAHSDSWQFAALQLAPLSASEPISSQRGGLNQSSFPGQRSEWRLAGHLGSAIGPNEARRRLPLWRRARNSSGPNGRPSALRPKELVQKVQR